MTPTALPTPMPAFAPVLICEDGEAVEEGSGGRGTAEELADAIPKGVVEDDELDELVEVAGCLVAVLAAAPSVVKAVPALSIRNLPTPVSQQSLVWSQQ